MTLEQKKLIACAELEGWRYVEPPTGCPDPTYWERYINGKQEIVFGLDELPSYAASLDAIVPVVIKWCDDEVGGKRWIKFFEELERLHAPHNSFITTRLISLTRCFNSSASQIRDALLLAAGKMPVE